MWCCTYVVVYCNSLPNFFFFLFTINHCIKRPHFTLSLVLLITHLHCSLSNVPASCTCLINRRMRNDMIYTTKRYMQKNGKLKSAGGGGRVCALHLLFTAICSQYILCTYELNIIHPLHTYAITAKTEIFGQNMKYFFRAINLMN